MLLYNKDTYICVFTVILKDVVSKCVEGASVSSICEFGDTRLTEETGKVFRKDKEKKKGIVFYQILLLEMMLHKYIFCCYTIELLSRMRPYFINDMNQYIACTSPMGDDALSSQGNM